MAGWSLSPKSGVEDSVRIRKKVGRRPERLGIVRMGVLDGYVSAGALQIDIRVIRTDIRLWEALGCLHTGPVGPGHSK